MALKDKEKWNKKYEETPRLLQQRDASPKLIEAIKYVTGNKALEIACGAGRNSMFLASNNFEVLALDISEVALKTLDERGFENIKTQIADLEEHKFEEGTYDLIVQTNYLERKIIPSLKKALKKNGIIVIETYMNHEENEKPPSNPDFLLKENELKNIFSDFEILEYDEYFNEKYELYKMRKQSIIAKKI